ncbi:MAG: sulfotransferase, partial [Pirellulaceae bacterium]|nr:sulfotransferase [Pirellulaceae bacterium]
MTDQDRPKTAQIPKAKFHPYPWYAPRFWHGMRAGTWLKMLASHRFSVHPFRVPMAFAISNFSLFNSIFYRLEQSIHGKAIASTAVEKPVVFIIGHWRSGTTLLHELLDLDTQFRSPTTYECFVPHHFLLTQSAITKIFWYTLPSKRPMDNMATGWKRPQEDEFALMNMGLPSTYLRTGYPNDTEQYLDYLNLENLSTERRNEWKEGLDRFIKTLTYTSKKQILLKSPPHTGRVAILRELYPNAKFIHITRSPYSVVPSTIRLWQSLNGVQGLQLDKNTIEAQQKYVFDCYHQMYP